MYGLVNKGIQTLLIDGFGQDVWEKVKEKSGVDDAYESMTHYPDDTTVGLAVAASEVLDISLADVLIAYGKWWIDYTLKDHPALFEKAGGNFFDWVANLNETHRRVGYMMSKADHPEFEITDRTDNSFVLHYHSNREGLYPFVIGLLQGLGEAFDTQVTVTHLSGPNETQDHDTLRVEYASKQ